MQKIAAERGEVAHLRRSTCQQRFRHHGKVLAHTGVCRRIAHAHVGAEPRAARAGHDIACSGQVCDVDNAIRVADALLHKLDHVGAARKKVDRGLLTVVGLMPSSGRDRSL